MEPYLVKALGRAGLKLVVGLGVIGALVGYRIAHAPATGLDGDLAELDRLAVELESEATASASAQAGTSDGAGAGPVEGASGGDALAADAMGRDRLVRCRIEGALQYMRAADCEMRAGRLEEIPPPAPESNPTASAAHHPASAPQPPASAAN